MKWNDIYRSDSHFDTMGAAQRIVDWYEEVYDLNDERKAAIDELLGAHEVSGQDPEAMFRKLLTVHPQALSKLQRNIKNIMRRR